MRIVHIHLLGPYTDGWGYQENILPAIQAKQGHDVTVIANCQTHLPDNTIVKTEPAEYCIERVQIIRIDYKKTFANDKINLLICDYPVEKLLLRLRPDVILLHGMGRGLVNFAVRHYLKKHPNCILYGDVHAFAGNTENATQIHQKLIAAYWNASRKILYKYYKSVLCISQQCWEYARDVYQLPEEKLKLFPLGYDPDSIPWENASAIRKTFREKYGIKPDEIVIAHGGKIIPRRKTEMAIEAVERLNKDVRLVVFGAIDNGIRDSIMARINESNKVIYMGHLSKEEYIKVFLAADIAFFPGAQSSMWEEAIGCGLPLLINVTEEKDLPYFDRGGNVAISKDDSAQSFAEELERMIITQDYKKMAKIASEQGREFFSYENIAAIVTAVEE